MQLHLSSEASLGSLCPKLLLNCTFFKFYPIQVQLYINLNNTQISNHFFVCKVYRVELQPSHLIATKNGKQIRKTNFGMVPNPKCLQQLGVVGIRSCRVLFYGGRSPGKFRIGPGKQNFRMLFRDLEKLVELMQSILIKEWTHT